MKKFIFTALAATAFFAAGSASAATLFDQTSTVYTNRYVSQNFEAANQAFNGVVIDDFTLASSSHVTSITAAFVGFAGFQSFANIEAFDLHIYSSAAAAANGNLTGDVYDLIIKASNATNLGTFLVTAHPDDPAATYRFGTDFDLAAGTYFIGVTAFNNFDTNGEVGIATGGLGDATLITPNGGFAQSSYGLGQNAGYRIDGEAIAAVPEPATWTMMLAGFGLIGIGARLRKRLAVTFAQA